MSKEPASARPDRETPPFNLQSARVLLARVTRSICTYLTRASANLPRPGAGRIPNERFRRLVDCEVVRGEDGRRLATSSRGAGNLQIDRLSRLIGGREGARRGRGTRNYANARGYSLRNLQIMCITTTERGLHASYARFLARAS